MVICGSDMFKFSVSKYMENKTKKQKTMIKGEFQHII